MVLKHLIFRSLANFMFENDVKMYGTQADEIWKLIELMFENDVKMYGTQANATKIE